ncbi:MAG: DUF192 domain-containing protein [Candidatus Buchananbacteria bacterium]|nr:DUF192 domain-containing protein [Candidatus Buchananbacteria bacterium]
MEKDSKNKKISLVITVAVIFILALLLWLLDFFSLKPLSFKDKKVIIAGQEINVKIARTPSEQSLGLGKTKTLAENNGLFFVYNNYVIPSYWMKDMEFPIDIIWIKDNMVMGYEKDLKPQGNNANLPIYQPKTFINYVLEVNAGFADKHGLKIGDRVEIR